MDCVPSLAVLLIHGIVRAAAEIYFLENQFIAPFTLVCMLDTDSSSVIIISRINKTEFFYISKIYKLSSELLVVKFIRVAKKISVAILENE